MHEQKIKTKMVNYKSTPDIEISANWTYEITKEIDKQVVNDILNIALKTTNVNYSNGKESDDYYQLTTFFKTILYSLDFGASISYDDKQKKLIKTHEITLLGKNKTDNYVCIIMSNYDIKYFQEIDNELKLLFSLHRASDEKNFIKYFNMALESIENTCMSSIEDIFDWKVSYIGS